jgi:glutamyl-Q tRNA(Asp) synthetase
MPAAERQRRLAAGTQPAWRLDSARAAACAGPLHFTDLRHGAIEVDPGLLGDVILARKDIGAAYHLAVVVDDGFQRITHVTRGEDLLAATHLHRLLQALLELPEPCYLHHRLILDDQGRRLAKRHDALALATLREQGHSPAAVLAMIAGG